MKRKALLVALLAVLAFIWIHSLIPGNISSEESNWVTNALNPILEKILGITLSEGFVRKLAHVFEYTVYAVLLTIFWRGQFKTVALCGFFTAFIDETLQIFSGRGPMILDVWIDCLGIGIGFGVTWFILRLYRNHNIHSNIE